MQPTRHIQRFPWGTADDAQVLIVHFGSKSTPMIAQLLRHIGLRSRVIDAADVPAVIRTMRSVVLEIGRLAKFRIMPAEEDPAMVRMIVGLVALTAWNPVRGPGRQREQHDRLARPRLGQDPGRAV